MTRTTALALTVLAGVCLAGCTTSTSARSAKHEHAGKHQNVSTFPPHCTNTAPDVYIRESGGPNGPNTQLIGGVSLIDCRYTDTRAYLAETAPTDMFYCTSVALVSNNPNYDLAAAPPLHHVDAHYASADGSSA